MPGEATTEMLPQKIKAWACRFIAEPRTWKGPGSFPSTYLLGKKKKKHDNEDNILPIMTEPMGLIQLRVLGTDKSLLYFFLLLIFFFFVIIENL